MSLRLAIAVTLLVSATLTCSVGAEAAPTEVTVRIEGATRTLFEGPILSDGHDVRASSDAQSRHCDGTNNAAHPAPVPTPTAASVDAMELVGQSFDGSWFPGFDDYFVERWGPDAQAPPAFWGILVNGVLISVGGCQFADRAGDEVLWVYDAFSGHPLLRLAAAGDPSAAPDPPALTAHVEVGHPLDLSVQSYTGAEGQSPTVEAADGVVVAPVETEAGSGYETVETASPAAVTTAADGSASVTFSTPGWRRLKAQDDPGTVRSNRLDVCVEPVGGGGCGPLPPDAALRVPARYTPPPAQAPLAAGPRAAPSNAFLLRRGRLNARNGTATIAVLVPGPGRLTLAGRGVHPVSAEAGSAGSVRLRLSPTAATAARLRRLGRVRVAVRVGFTPTGGAASTKDRLVTLRLGP